jgi:hypothetical protein
VLQVSVAVSLLWIIVFDIRLFSVHRPREPVPYDPLVVVSDAVADKVRDGLLSMLLDHFACFSNKFF